MTITSTRFRVLAALLALVVLLAACGGDSQGGEETDDGGQTTPTESGDGDTAADPEGVDRPLVIGITEDLTGLNPLRRPSTVIMGVMSNIWDLHMLPNAEEGGTDPHVFESWEANEDVTEWYIEIREGITFSNGDPLTAEDVKFSLDYLKRDDMQGEDLSIRWADVASVEVTGEYSLTIHSDGPSPAMMQVGDLPILPKDYYEEVGDEGFEAAPIGSGAYKLVEWRPGEHVRLEANEDHWRGPPAIKDVTFRVVPDEAALGASFLSGELHIAQNIPLELYQQIQNIDNLSTQIATSARHYLLLNTLEPPFDDVRMRRALNHAIDWDTIIEQLLDGLPPRTASVLTRGEWGWNPDLEPYAYDPDLASELVEEAGYPDGVDVEYIARGGVFEVERVATAVQPYLEAVGIRPTIRSMARGDVENLALQRGLPAITSTNMAIGPEGIGMEIYMSRFSCDPELHSLDWGGWYCNERFDELRVEALELWAEDFDAAEAKVMEMEKIMYEDAGIGFSYMIPRLYGVDARLDWLLPATQFMHMYFAHWTE